jgi:hypothetical protein
MPLKTLEGTPSAKESSAPSFLAGLIRVDVDSECSALWHDLFLSPDAFVPSCVHVCFFPELDLGEDFVPLMLDFCYWNRTFL